MIDSVISTLFQVSVPLSIPAIAGIILVRFKNLKTTDLLIFVLYFLSPCMIFNSLINARISLDDLYKTVLFCIINLVLLWGASTISGKILKLPAPRVAGLTLIATLTNCANYGLPLVLLAFGQLGLEKASVFVVIQIIIGNTFGVYFAARSHFSLKDAVKSVFSLPAIYAVLFAVLLRALNLSLPDSITNGIAMAANSYSPVVLTILGAQMASVQNSTAKQECQKTFYVGMALRLFFAPLIALLVLYLLNVKGMLFSVLFILSSMPVAVNSGILAENFNASPKIVAKCILWSTLFSLIYLPILIVLVK